MIIPAQIANEVLQGGRPQTFENAGNIRFVNAGWGDAPADGVIPTAFHVDSDSFEPPPRWMLDTDENLTAWAMAHGINANDTFIVSGANQLPAYRLAVILKYLGVSDVRVINGGNNAWLRAGFSLEEATPIVPNTDFGAVIPVNGSLIVPVSALYARLEQPQYLLLETGRGRSISARQPAIATTTTQGAYPAQFSASRALRARVLRLCAISETSTQQCETATKFCKCGKIRASTPV